MRHRTFALALGSLALAAPAALADMIPFASRVDAVTVFPAGASVHRVGRARVQAGDHQLVFSALPSELADDTVRIGGFGPGASAEAVSVRSGRLAELTGPEIARLAEQLAATQREQADTARRRDEIVRQRGAVTVIDQHLAELAVRAAQQTAALAQARAAGERVVKFVTVDVTTVHDGDLDLSIEYMLPNAASWRPSYAAHLDAAGGRVALDVFASVQQTTGEDWNNVRLSVSTVVPAAGLALPTFAEQAIELEAPEEAEVVAQLAIARARAGMNAAAGPATAPMPATDAARMVMPVRTTTPIEQRRGEAHPHLLSARLEIQAPATIRSGAPARRVLAAHAGAAAALEYQAAPRQSNSVYLAARFRNENTFPLLEGNVALFIGADYVGSTALRSVPIDEDVLLPFGVDAGVTIDRTLASRQVIGRNGRDETSLRYQYRLSNHRTRVANVTVFEQLPVSHSQGLAVQVTPGDQAPAAHHEGDAPGVLRWEMRVNPNATSRWNLGYVVSAPHRRGVSGEIE